MCYNIEIALSESVIKLKGTGVGFSRRTFLDATSRPGGPREVLVDGSEAGSLNKSSKSYFPFIFFFLIRFFGEVNNVYFLGEISFFLFQTFS